MTFSLLTPDIYFWGIIILATLTLGWVYRLISIHREVRALFWIRFAIFSLLVILILNPKVKYTYTETRPLTWNLYIDNSLSMDFHGNPTKSSLETAIQDLKRNLSEKASDVQIHYFSNSIQISDKGNRSSTDLGLVVKHIKESEPKGLAGAIIVTDGQSTQGMHPIQLSHELETPIYCIGVGDLSPMVDLSIESIHFPPIAIINEEVEMKIGVSSFGNIGQRIDVTLFQDGKLVGSKVLSVDGVGNTHEVIFRVKPSQLGNLSYQAKVSVLEDEVNILNNRQSMSLKVLKSKYRIGLLTGAPNYNTGILKDVLNKNPRFELEHFINVRNGFNPSLKSFWKTPYDLIILDNHPIEENALEWKNLSKILAKKIIAQKSSLLFIAGPESSNESFQYLLPLFSSKPYTHFLEDGRVNTWTFTDTIQSIFPYDYNLFMDMKDVDLPPLMSGIEIDSEGQIVIAQFQLQDLSIPVLLLGENSGFRHGVWTTPDLYSLHYKLIGTQRADTFPKMWDGIFSWLMKTGGDQQYFFRLDKKSYQQGEQIVVTGVGGQQKNSLHNGTIRLYKDGEWVEDKPLKYDLKSNEFHGKYWTTSPGDYQYDIVLENGTNQQLVGQGTYTVQESKIELNRVFLNQPLLQALSEITRGKYLRWNEKNQIYDYVNSEDMNVKKVNNYILNENIFLLGFILVLLTVEWILRRKLGFL